MKEYDVKTQTKLNPILNLENKNVNDTSGLEKEIVSIKIRLKKALTSNLPYESVVRIIQYEQEELHLFLDSIEKNVDLDDNLFKSIQCKLCDLIHYTYTYYHRYINQDKNVPFFFIEDFINKHKLEAIELQSKINGSSLDGKIKSSLNDYLNSIIKHHYTCFTYKHLIYFKHFLKVLNNIGFGDQKTETSLVQVLLEINFNHLQLFRYQQNTLQVKLSAINNYEEKVIFIKEKLIEIPDRQNSEVCYTAWPSVHIMISKWLKEELSSLLNTPAFEKVIPYQNHDKIQLDISVAQLACIVKCFYEEFINYSITVKSVLQMITKTVATKRQSDVSYKSLSKAYYSVDQNTAAAVLNILENITLKIKKFYFN